MNQRSYDTKGNFLLDDDLENYHKCIETPWYEYPEFKEISEDNYLIKPDNFFFEWENYIFIALDSGRDWFDGTLADLLEMMQKGEAPKGTGLTEEQINKLRSLERAKRKIIFMHHPAINYKVEGCIDNYRDVFIEYCKDPENNVEVVLTGHTHQDGVYNADWIYRGPSWGFWHPPLLYDRPLFVQTRSATKSGLGLYPCFPGYRVIGVGETSTCGISYTTPEFVPVIKAVTTGPINLHAYNSKGEHTGFGSAEVNIPKSFYTGNYNGTAPAMPQMIILYNTSDDYIFKVTANLESSNLTKQTLNSEINESFNLTIEKRTNDSLTTISYQNISITRNTTANVSFNQTATNYTMEIDTDGDGEIDEYKAPNSTETNYAPTATIISPENNSIFIHGYEITFTGTGTDPEEGILTDPSLVWSSDMYGIIGVGNKFSTFNLSAGTHKISLRVNDSAGLSGLDSIELTVNAPDLTLNSADISFAKPTEDEIIQINVTVHNIGFVTAANVTVHIFDGFPEFQISNLTVNSIPVGESRTVNATWNTTGKMGNHTISVMIDPDDLIEDMNETDNQASRFIVVAKNEPPIAKFTFSPEKPGVNQTITFNASNSTDTDGFITKYKWEFGDGTNGTGELITHSYSSAGNYTVNLTVTDSDGATNATAKMITVSSMPDLVITAKWLCWPDNCTICYNVTNIGNGTAPACHNTTLYVDDVAVAHDHVPVDLAPGKSYIGCFNGYVWTYTPPSDNITVCADNNETVDEVDEDNNCLTNIWMCGDVTGDGRVRTSDGIRIFHHITYGVPIDNMWVADVTGDGRVRTSDGIRIFHHITYGIPLNCKCSG